MAFFRRLAPEAARIEKRNAPVDEIEERIIQRICGSQIFVEKESNGIGDASDIALFRPCQIATIGISEELSDRNLIFSSSELIGFFGDS